MLIEIITGGLSVIASITTILQNQLLQAQSDREEHLRASLQYIQTRVLALENEITRLSYSSVDDENLLTAYSKLLDALRENRHYSFYLEFRPTDHGTWLLVRKRRKRTILRDPQGEYASTTTGTSE